MKRSSPSHPGYVAIGKTRTLFWEHIYNSREKPFVLYDPSSRPRFSSVSGVSGKSSYASGLGSSSSYDAGHFSTESKARFHLLAGWMKPALNDDYCEHIYRHISHLDHVYLVGGGIGRWSGINNFIRYLEKRHPQAIDRITPVRYFRLTDFPEKKLMEIFKRISSDS